MDPARDLEACSFLAPDLGAEELASILVTRCAEDGLVCAALRIATEAHRMHLRDEGVPYIVHPIRVSLSLLELGSPPEVLAAGLLHDVFEDAPSHAPAVFRLDPVVADLVEALTDDWYEDYYAKILASGTDACRVKIADRVDNLRFLHFTGPGKQARYVRETARNFPPLISKAASPRLAGALTALLEWHLGREAFVTGVTPSQGDERGSL